MIANAPATADPSWHDNLIYGIHFCSADPDRGLWRSDLVLDIDHIVEWICGEDGGVQFLVAPATLVFHDVIDLKIAVDFGASGDRQNINELSIAEIVKAPVEHPWNPGVGPYFGWRIELNLPPGGEIVFGASGYSQTYRAEPQRLDEQHLKADDRPPLVMP